MFTLYFNLVYLFSHFISKEFHSQAASVTLRPFEGKFREKKIEL